MTHHTKTDLLYSFLYAVMCAVFFAVVIAGFEWHKDQHPQWFGEHSNVIGGK